MCEWCHSLCIVFGFVFFFFKQKTAYEMRISDWSSDVCSSDLRQRPALQQVDDGQRDQLLGKVIRPVIVRAVAGRDLQSIGVVPGADEMVGRRLARRIGGVGRVGRRLGEGGVGRAERRSEGPQSELQYLMSLSYAVI